MEKKNKNAWKALVLASYVFLVSSCYSIKKAKSIESDKQNVPQKVVQINDNNILNIRGNDEIVIIDEKKDNNTIAYEVIDGLWGNGEERKKLLTENGYNYDEIMNIVNEILCYNNCESQNSNLKVSINAAYINKDKTIFYDENDNVICFLDKYEKVFLKENYHDDKRLVNIPSIGDGYIANNTFNVLPNTYIEVDISEQIVKMYIDDEEVFRADIISGNPNVGNTPGTNLGYTEIMQKLYKTYLTGPTWNSYVDIFMQFNDSAEGFHDADGWRSDDEYNDKERYKTNGSHGCINMKQKDAETLDSLCEVGTKVLIHK